MRLFLLPISTRQSLIYCQRLNLQLTNKATYLDKITTKATTTWLGWEKRESGWQKKVTTYGNKLFQRLPHEEWGLKSIPPLSERRRSEEVEGKEEVCVEYPDALIEPGKVTEALRKLGGAERQAFHTKWLWGSVLGMPISAPVALLPIIPNLPFFYLCFRAWSHWRARSGSKHLEFLLDNNLIRLAPSESLRTAYKETTTDSTLTEPDAVSKSGNPPQNSDLEERLILSKSSAKPIADSVQVPGLEVEIERAVWQVERAIKARQERKEEKAELEAANEKGRPKH